MYRDSPNDLSTIYEISELLNEGNTYCENSNLHILALFLICKWMLSTVCNENVFCSCSRSSSV